MMIFVSLTSFVIYLLTLGPSFDFLDSPELIALTYRLDILHPPGHPLYALLGKCLTFLPFGSIAFRINLLSAFFASLTATLIYLLIHSFLEQSNKGTTPVNAYPLKISSLVGTLSIVFTYSFWAQAVRAEVYSLNSFLVSILTFLLIRLVYYEKEDNPDRSNMFLLFSFLLGMAYGNHTIAITSLLPAFLLLLIIRGKHLMKSPRLLVLALFFLLFGVSVYLYLPARSSTPLYFDWGNPDTFDRFMTIVSARQYQANFSFPGKMQLLRNLNEHFHLFSDQFTYILLFFALVGLIFLMKSNFLLSSFTVILFMSGLAGTVMQPRFLKMNPDAHGYLFTSFLVLALWFSYGVYLPLTRFFSLRPASGKLSILKNHWVLKTCSLFLMFIPLMIFFRAYPYTDRSNGYFPKALTQVILDPLTPDSIIFSRGDNILFPFWYYQICENRYQDLMVIDQNRFGNLEEIAKMRSQYKNNILFPSIESMNHWIRTSGPWITTDPEMRGFFPPWGKILFQKVIHMNIDTHDIYYQGGENDLLASNHLLPEHMIYRVQKNSLETLTPMDLKKMEDFWRWMGNQWKAYPYLLNDAPIKDAFSKELYNLGNYFAYFKLWDKAISLYRDSIELQPEMAQAHINLGICYYTLGLKDEGIRETETGVYYDPNNATYLSNLASLYLEKGDLIRAEIYFSRAIEINPHHKIAQENLEKLKSILKQNGKKGVK